MLLYLYHVFKAVRPAFTRERAWILGCSVILGFIGCWDMAGVSSLCRFWGLNEQGYLALLHFFQATSWDHQRLMRLWTGWVLKQAVAVDEEGRLVVIADHSLVVKDGRQMPGVVTLRQDSETQSKPSYFRGHCWGVLGLLVGSLERCFCLPFQAELHQGHVHVGEEKLSMSQQPVQMALDFARTHQRYLWLILDAFFAASPVFKLASGQRDADGRPWVEVLTKAKKGYVAYTLDGTQRVPLDEGFDAQPLSQGECRVYAEPETVSYRAQNLLWHGELVRFIWVQSSQGRMVLMSSDLMLDPLRAVELYCGRMRIESTFDRLKHLLKAFEYHFWSKGLPRHSRRPRKNSTLEAPATPEALEAVKRCWRAYERFVSLGCLALGLLQVLALKYPQQILAQHQRFLRTRPQGIPSEGVVKDVLATLIQDRFGKVSAGATLGDIHAHFASAGFLWEAPKEETHWLCDSA